LNGFYNKEYLPSSYVMLGGKQYVMLVYAQSIPIESLNQPMGNIFMSIADLN